MPNPSTQRDAILQELATAPPQQPQQGTRNPLLALWRLLKGNGSPPARAPFPSPDPTQAVAGSPAAGVASGMSSRMSPEAIDAYLAEKYPGQPAGPAETPEASIDPGIDMTPDQLRAIGGDPDLKDPGFTMDPSKFGGGPVNDPGFTMKPSRGLKPQMDPTNTPFSTGVPSVDQALGRMRASGSNMSTDPMSVQVPEDDIVSTDMLDDTDVESINPVRGSLDLTKVRDAILQQVSPTSESHMAVNEPLPSRQWDVGTATLPWLGTKRLSNAVSKPTTPTPEAVPGWGTVGNGISRSFKKFYDVLHLPK